MSRQLKSSKNLKKLLKNVRLKNHEEAELPALLTVGGYPKAQDGYGKGYEFDRGAYYAPTPFEAPVKEKSEDGKKKTELGGGAGGKGGEAKKPKQLSQQKSQSVKKIKLQKVLWRICNQVFTPLKTCLMSTHICKNLNHI